MSECPGAAPFASTVFLQRPSAWLVVLAWGAIARAREVLVCPRQDLGREAYGEAQLRRVARVVHAINPRVGVRELSQETIAPLWHENNVASERAVAQILARLRPRPLLRMLRRVLPTEVIERYLAIRLLPWMLSETLFYRTARELAQAVPLVAVPASDDPYGFHRAVMSDEECRQLVPAVVRQAHAIWRRISRALNTLCAANWLRLVLAPSHWALGLLATGRVARVTNPIRADVISPLICGFRDETDNELAGHSDAFLFGGELSSSRVVHYFGDWRFSPQEKRRQIASMREQGVRWVDAKDIRADVQFIAQAARWCARLWSGALRPSVLADDPRVATASALLARHVLKEWLFARGVAFKVSLEFQDHAPAHVVRTWIANQFGRLTVGMHHGAPATDAIMPFMRYSYMNRLGVWGPAFARLHGDVPPQMRLVSIGAYRADAILAAARSPQREVLQARYEQVFGGVRPLIVLLLPSLSWYIIPSRVDELLEGLRLVSRLNGEFRLICRFRTAALKSHWLSRGLGEIVTADPRILVDSAAFTTYEWVALSDLTIANGHSSGLVEAAAAGKWCVTFDYMMTGDRVFGRHGAGLVLKTREDLVRAVQARRTADASSDGDAATLASAFSYFSDGESLVRLRRTILEAVQEVDAAGGRCAVSPRRVCAEPLERELAAEAVVSRGAVSIQ